MTAREILDKHFKDNLPSKWNGEMWDKRIIDAMEEYANQQLLLGGVVGQSEQLNTDRENKDWATNDDVDEYFKSV